MTARKYAALAATILLGLTSCTSSQLSSFNTQVASAIAEGQLLCSVATITGPMVFPIINALDRSAVSVIGKTAPLVAQICAGVDGVPVAPPNNPAAVSPAPIAVNLPTGATS